MSDEPGKTIERVVIITDPAAPPRLFGIEVTVTLGPGKVPGSSHRMNAHALFPDDMTEEETRYAEKTVRAIGADAVRELAENFDFTVTGYGSGWQDEPPPNEKEDR